MSLTCTQILLCVGMLITGSLNTISKKAQNDCSAAGFPDSQHNGTTTEHKFDHPWFQTLIMFIGEMMCLFGLAYSRYNARKNCLRMQNSNLMVVSDTSDQPVMANSSHTSVFHWILAVPTIFDLIGTSLAGIGLIYVDASVWQMLRGSIILFTGILSKLFLKRNLKPLQWLGMVVTIIGLVLVGLSHVLRQEGKSQNNALLGILFILSGQLVSASQMIIEEIFLKRKNFEPLQIVGMEGVFGFFFMAVVVLPAMYFIPGSQIGNRYENTLDALYQIKNSYRLLIFSVLYLISIAFYNYFGLAVTRSLTAVHRTLMDACRTVVVWLVGLFVYYTVSEEFGESFDKKYGLFQIDGFLFLMIGTAFYNEILDVPCFPMLRKTPVETYPTLLDSNSLPETSEHRRELISTVSENSALLQKHSHVHYT